MSGANETILHIPTIARVDGACGLEIGLRDGRITRLHLRVDEPPRFFERLVEGRDGGDLLEVVARIDGASPVAHQVAAAQALESIFGAHVTPWVRDMRRAMLCGEWIRSHARHIHLMAAPDRLDLPDALAVIEAYPEFAQRGQRLLTLGEDLVALFGARPVHPVGIRLGGLACAPEPARVADLLPRLAEALTDAEMLVHWAAALSFPRLERPFTSVALSGGAEYPIDHGRIGSGDGLDIRIDEFERHCHTTAVAHSTALHAHLDGRPYLVGPLARLNLGFHQLPEPIRQSMKSVPIGFPSHNPFHAILARAVEVHLAIDEALRLLRDYRRPATPRVPIYPRAGVGYGACEAPSGLLWHRYETDANGYVRSARILSPTAQNLARMEQDLSHALAGLEQEPEVLAHYATQVIRNYAPSLACATH